MTSAIFRQLASAGESEKIERLFRAAISTFSALARPGREDIKRMDDLLVPLVPMVSIPARREASRILSRYKTVPPRLFQKLCDEPVQVSGPLLAHALALSDKQLIALIARHGLAHARMIAKRRELNPAIAALINAMVAQTDGKSEECIPDGGPDGAESIREYLRTILRSSGAANTQTGPTVQYTPPAARL